MKPGLHKAVHVVRIKIVIPLKYIPYLIIFLWGCTSNHVRINRDEADTFQFQRIIADTTNNIGAQIELEEYQLKKLLCAELGIYDIEHSQDSIELRLWFEPSMWEPHMLYIIKGKDTSWKAIRYVFYQRHNNYETQDYKHWDAYMDPIVDTIKAETLFPKEITWKDYLSNLQMDSLWTFPSQSELKGDFDCVDGSGYTVEIKDRRRYKAFRYRCAKGRNELHHERFTELVDKIIAPLGYKATINSF